MRRPLSFLHNLRYNRAMLTTRSSHPDTPTDAQRRAATLAALRATLATRRAQALPRPWDDAQLRAALARVEAPAHVNPHSWQSRKS
jgi:hypothetical protein